MTIEDLINQSKRLLLDFKPKHKFDPADFSRKYLEPARIHKSFNLLAPVGYQWHDNIWEFWPPYGKRHVHPDLGWNTVIIHGHERGKVCQNRDLCHVQGFIPVGNEHPWFLKEWEKFNYER